MNMENIHGVDVSWLHNTHARDSSPRTTRTERSTTIPTDNARTQRSNSAQKSNGSNPSTPRQTPQRPGPPLRNNSTPDRLRGTPGGFPPKPTSTSPTVTRRNSWLSSFSSKFSSSSPVSTINSTPTDQSSTPRSPATIAAASALSTTPEEEEPRPLGPGAPRNAVLPHGQKVEGNAPYTPVPPRSTHPNFLTSALRRFSSAGQLSTAPPRGNGGLCERRVLNVDVARERCQITELDQSKLRRVAFCVDVEIAGRPRYNDEVPVKKAIPTKKAGKGEGETLKQSAEAKDQKDKDGVVGASGEQAGKDAKGGANPAANGATEKPMSRKKEKKKRSDEERKARNEKKRKLAEENGTIPVELMRGDSCSSISGSSAKAPVPRSSSSPTTDPARIYRRCCQLRETPILKKITEQLALPSNSSEKPGVVARLDLTDCWLQLQDLVTLGDYLAVVPIKELIMENCGLTDEAVRIILAGLLAVASPYEAKPRHGAVQRVVLKNNPKIGRDGWRYISLFVNMSRSLRSLDVSMIPFPQPISPRPTENANAAAAVAAAAKVSDPAAILSKAIGTRLAAADLELLNMAETGLTAPQIGLLVDGAIQSGMKRIGLAGNNITTEGMEHVSRYLREAKCEGLDLGGNELGSHIDTLASALPATHPLYALSLANCSLTPSDLARLLPTLARLPNFHFIDLSHNPSLFTSTPSAVPLLRRHLPLLHALKRIHLSSCSLSPEQAIALAEIFPDNPGLAHVNLLANPALTALATAESASEAQQEEACALYASLMAAVRVSKRLICIDIDLPSTSSSEVVKALAKQVVAYSLRNMERGFVAEITGPVVPSSSDPSLYPLPPVVSGDNGGDDDGDDDDIAVPDVLAHLVGRSSNDADDDDGDDAVDDDASHAPDEDYVIGGTGVVKALGICLKNRSSDSRRASLDAGAGAGGVGVDISEDNHTDVQRVQGMHSVTKIAGEGAARGARDMSKNLLGSARRIRARLQPALLREVAGGGVNYHKLLFLDQALSRMIDRFEHEYPDTKIPAPSPSAVVTSTSTSTPTSDSTSSIDAATATDGTTTGSTVIDATTTTTTAAAAAADEYALLSDEEDTVAAETGSTQRILSRHNSDVSLKSRALVAEEGRMLRRGVRFGGEGGGGDVEGEGEVGDGEGEGEGEEPEREGEDGEGEEISPSTSARVE